MINFLFIGVETVLFVPEEASSVGEIVAHLQRSDYQI